MSVLEEPAGTIAQSTKTQGLTNPAGWISPYIRYAIMIDLCCALVASVVGLTVRFGSPQVVPWPNVALSIGLPLAWLPCVAVARAYEPRFFGVGSDEFRRLLNAGISLTAAVAVVSYATKAEFARGYVLLALPLLTFLDLVARYRLRKRLHRLRARGRCMHRVVAVGHRGAVADLIRELRRTPYHGLEIAAVCLASDGDVGRLDGVPVLGGFDDVVVAIRHSNADTVAVLACPEMDGLTLRRLAWQLEKADIDLLVAPALMDVAGPRTTIRPSAGLPLLHVDHPELAGARRLFKTLYDKVIAGLALFLLAPVLIVIAVIVASSSRGPALFVQTRIGKDGRRFRILKFRTMVTDAEHLRAGLLADNEQDEVLFKIRTDPRLTPIGAWLRRYSLDELPQLVNVLRGDMSLVGPRPRCRRRSSNTAAMSTAGSPSSRA